MKENDIIKDRYQLLRPLGAGGFGEVWLAKDQIIGTDCALKFYVRLDDKGREEFRDEYRRMLGIHDAHLLTASYYDEWQGRPFLVMDYCGGGAASGRVGQLGETELWRLIRDVASGLACLHSQRDARGKEAPVIHQDIKPDNFLQKGDGTWLISDFGISSRMRSSMSSQSGREVSLGGTIRYMGPERFGQDRMLVKASDIWSIGASIYEMATGDVPFGEYGGGAQRAGAEIPHLPGERWSSDLDRLVSSCLQKETWDRPTAELVAEYADSKLKGKPLPRLPKETPPPPKPNPNPNPKPKLWKWMAAAGAVVAVVLAIVLWPEPDSPVNPDTEAYDACRTVADYRAYMRDYGRNALHYAEAKKFVDDHVADSTAQAQQQLAQQQAQQQAAAEAKAQAEAERKEEAAYGKCTTVSGCNSYLKTYPNGKYVEEVRAKKAELEQQAQQLAQSSSQANTSSASLTGSANGHEWVDLGLPSGTLWATYNIGASSSEGYGNYYAWGETSTKSTYLWDTYKYANGAYDKLTKYCYESNYGNNGFTDNLTTLQAGDDPATAQWGSGWRTPSKTQWDELLNNTTRKWTTQNGKAGYLFTSKKNGQSVFLPAAGVRWDSGLNGAGSHGFYWSRSLDTGDPYRVWGLYFSSDDCGMYSGSYRYYGFSMRPVREK